jgi:predicted DNA-binding transcriptional regulator AlpA
MNNPFENINGRLETIEELLNRLLLQRSDTTTISEIGGIELAQQVTRLSKARIYALVSTRELPHAKRGGRLFFNRSELLAWVADGKRATTSEESRTAQGGKGVTRAA